MMRLQTCRICGYRWPSRVAAPKQCPRCKRMDWKRKISIRRQKRKRGFLEEIFS